MKIIIRNERGGASLVYVFMISLVLLVFTPVILSMTSNDSARNITDNNTLISTNLAVSGIETFISYLDSFTTGNRVSYVNNYAAFGTKSYLLPEGTPVSYTLSKAGPNNNIFTVTMTASAGTGNLARTKTVVYQITAATASGTMITPDPNQRLPVANSPDTLYLQTDSPTGVPNAVTVIPNIDLKKVIGDSLSYHENNVNTIISSYSSSAVVCNCSNENDINTAVNNALKTSTPNPIVIEMANDIAINTNNVSLTWGEASRPVVLIFKSLTFNNKATLNVTGDLIFKKSLTVHNKSEITLKKSVNSYGNLYVADSLTGNNGIELQVPGTVYTGNFTINNNNDYPIQAERLIVKNSFTVNNNVTLNVTSDIITGSLTVHNNSDLTAKAGDIFVQNNFLASNNINITSGGVMAVGGDFTIWGTNRTINTGGATTSLLLDGTGGGGSLNGWNPSRQ
jgi:hypothetical protein